MVVYALQDPFSKEIRYVGQTAKNLEVRVRQHLTKSSLAKPGHKNNPTYYCSVDQRAKAATRQARYRLKKVG
jgi:hypothetical protein